MSNENWKRVRRGSPCPICDHTDWCLIARDESAAICQRIESKKRVGESGYLHVLVEHRRDWKSRPRRVPIKRKSKTRDFTSEALWCCGFADRHNKAEELADQLGVSEGSLQRLRVGWYASEECWTLPLWNNDGAVTGIVRRFSNGSKKLFAGHHAGLYRPHDLPLDLSGETLLVCEGGSDVAAALDLGFAAVGRFSCTHGAEKLIADLIKDRHVNDAVIVADTGNEIEIRGAESLATSLLPYVRELKLIAPPMKDLRSWLNKGATRDDVLNLIAKATPRRLRVGVRYAG